MADAALDHLAAHYQGMPPVRALQLSVDGYDDGRLHLSAPLAANVNDKGCAFGGSLASLMTLAAWGRVWLGLHAEGIEADIYVADSHIRYLAPLYDDLRAEAMLAPEADWPGFVAAIRARGRGRIDLAARVALPDGTVAASFAARFAAIARAAG